MRNTREILRQKWLLKRPHRAIGASVGVSLGAVSLALKRAADAQLTWDVVELCDDAELEARLYPTVVPDRTVWASYAPLSKVSTGHAALGFVAPPDTCAHAWRGSG